MNRNRGNLAQYEGAWHLLWEGGRKEKARSGVVDLMASAEVPKGVAREFTCEATELAANDSGILKGFRVWTAGEPPTQEAIARILGVMLGERTTVPVRAGEMGSA